MSTSGNSLPPHRKVPEVAENRSPARADAPAHGVSDPIPSEAQPKRREPDKVELPRAPEENNVPARMPGLPGTPGKQPLAQGILAGEAGFPHPPG